MSEKSEVSAQVVESLDLDAVELAPTAEQEREFADSCMAFALDGLGTVEKDGVRSSVQSVQGDLSAALDRIKRRRARMSLQMDRLRDKKATVEGGTARISSLYAYAGPAINACPDAADAARKAKEGSDIVHARLNEIEYQMSLIQAGDVVLATEERELSGAMSALDEMVLALR